MHYPVVDGLALVLVDVAMRFAWLALLLVFFSRFQRFPQTLSALFGVGIILAAIDLLVSSVLLFTGASRDLTVEWNLLQLIVVALVVGRILMQAIDRGLFTGIALVLAMLLSTDAVATLVLKQL
jgi:hypothetical protein